MFIFEWHFTANFVLQYCTIFSHCLVLGPLLSVSVCAGKDLNYTRFDQNDECIFRISLSRQTGLGEPNLTQCEVLQVSNCAASIDHYLVVQTHISCTTTKRWKSVPTISKACIFIFKSQFFSCFQIETLYNIILIQRSP